MHQLIEMQAGECPRDVAAIFEGDRLTYGDLDRRANRLAHQLCELGVTPETPVGIFMDRSLELVVSILAVLKAGGACVPLEPSYPDTWLSYVAEDVALSVILTQPPLRPRLAAGHAQVLTVGLDALDDGPSTNPEVDIDFENAAFVFYTSGSTGQPKGVVSTHGARAERMQWTQAHYPALPGSRHILKTSIGFNRLVREYFCPLTTGGCMVVARPGGNQDCVYLLDLIRRHEVQAINFAPSMLRVFLEEPGLESCPSLRHVMCTGEALPVDLQRRFFQRLPHAKLHAFYGASEVPMAMYWDCRPDEDRLSPTAGLPAGTNIYLLDDQQRPVGEGAIGGDPCRRAGARARVRRPIRSHGRALRPQSLRRDRRRW